MTYVRRATTDRDEAEEVVTDLYLPNRLDVSAGSDPLGMEVTGMQVGALTVGRLTYGRQVRLRTADAEHFHVNIPLRGRSASRAGTSDLVITGPGEGLAFSPGSPAEILWSADCEQLCLMIPRERLEAELEALLGRSVTGRLRFEFAADTRAPRPRPWRRISDLLMGELDDPTGLVDIAHAGAHVESLVLDTILLRQPHNHRDALVRVPSTGRRVEGSDGLGPAIRRAVELIEDHPAEPWTTVRLAATVHVSVRALQEGFRRDLDTTPMTYLRRTRLRRAREALVAADGHTTTVRAVAARLGILHLGRFAAAYRAAFGEPPSQTLRRSA